MTTDLELPWYYIINPIHIYHLYIRVEKYRPIVLNDVVGNHEIVSRLKAIAKVGNVPNILLSVRFQLMTGPINCHRDLLVLERPRASCVWRMSCLAQNL